MFYNIVMESMGYEKKSQESSLFCNITEMFLLKHDLLNSQQTAQ